MIIKIENLNSKKINDFCYKGPSGCFDYFVLPKKKIIIIKDNSLEKGRNLKKEIVTAEIEIILDTLSWILDIPIKNYKLQHVKKDITTKNCNVYTADELFDNKINEEKYELLSAWREIQNEENQSLKYLMYYRLLEIIAVKRGYRGEVDKLLKNQKFNVQFIRNRRNRKQMVSMPSHLRNKIHPTKNSYKFPYRSLRGGEKLIKKIVRKIISDTLIS